jgi:nucleoside-diphosphate-sugar epimerase
VRDQHKRILITGASGCVGQYLAETLIRQTSHELFLLVRDPKKLRIDTQARPGITVIPVNLHEIDALSGLLQTIDTAILTATVWGGDDVYDINVNKTVELINLLDPDRCAQVLYFSTESILGHDNTLLPEALECGTPYIRSKYLCHQKIQSLAIAPKVTTIFPTLVFGGDERKPYSQISAGLADVMKWMTLVRFFQADGSFHFTHAQDIATVVAHLVDHPPALGESRELVLGNPAIHVNQAIEEICAYLQQRIYFRIPISLRLADLLIMLFQVQVSDWDRFCLRYRHFTHTSSITPATFGLPVYCPTIPDLLKISGILPPQPRKALASS